MFETISGYLGRVFRTITDKGSLTQRDVDEALENVERALVEADVNRKVVADLMASVRDKALGQDLLKSVTPAQQIVKIVYDEILGLLLADGEGPAARVPGKRKSLDDVLFKSSSGPTVYLFAGLQGSGKTTTLAKVARKLISGNKKRVLAASMDVYRPAAQDQLAALCRKVGVDVLPVESGDRPPAILKSALNTAKLKGYDYLLLDTAGRLHIDERLLAELVQIHKFSKPHETLLVADSLTGQIAADVASAFRARVPLTGLVLTRVDGDGRGGAALSMRAVSGVPIKLLGVGEKVDDLDVFQADRIAGRILGMGDIIDLVSKVQEIVKKEEADRMTQRLRKGLFDLNDMASQLRHMGQMGGLKGVLGMMPTISKKAGSDLGEIARVADEGVIRRHLAIISAMTEEERSNPETLNASRRRRIAAGAGVDVVEVNKLLRMYKQIADLYKKMSQNKGGTLAGMMDFFKLMSTRPAEVLGPKLSMPEVREGITDEDEDNLQRLLKGMPSAVDPRARKELFKRMRGGPAGKKGGDSGHEGGLA